jgi:hypothetical protein
VLITAEDVPSLSILIFPASISTVAVVPSLDFEAVLLFTTTSFMLSLSTLAIAVSRALISDFIVLF